MMVLLSFFFWYNEAKRKNKYFFLLFLYGNILLTNLQYLAISIICKNTLNVLNLNCNC
jgi:hypothetical protein